MLYHERRPVSVHLPGVIHFVVSLTILFGELNLIAYFCSKHINNYETLS